ncbi:hypothetical protein GGX14DRAFT_405015 [Mycena pura]|uniref:Uncharacterized protein n=1 Tax=Mycena pura TaxID=153505 RepID=A0AAD6UUS2_9AGAR|nr:hypothetical protein GGX14DRAFT_405015 [Mycena pura]
MCCIYGSHGKHLQLVAADSGLALSSTGNLLGQRSDRELHSVTASCPQPTHYGNFSWDGLKEAEVGYQKWPQHRRTAAAACFKNVGQTGAAKHIQRSGSGSDAAVQRHMDPKLPLFAAGCGTSGPWKRLGAVVCGTLQSVTARQQCDTSAVVSAAGTNNAGGPQSAGCMYLVRHKESQEQIFGKGRWLYKLQGGMSPSYSLVKYGLLKEKTGGTDFTAVAVL